MCFPFCSGHFPRKCSVQDLLGNSEEDVHLMFYSLLEIKTICFNLFWPLKMDVWRMKFLCGAKDLYVLGRFGNIGDEQITHTPIGIVVTRDQLNGMTQKLCWSCCYCCCDSSDFCGKWTRLFFFNTKWQETLQSITLPETSSTSTFGPKGNKRQTNHPLLGAFAISFRVISLLNRVITPVTPIYFRPFIRVI